MIKKFSHEWFVKLGEKGGKGCSEKKKQAIIKNLENARARRWPKEKQDGQ